MLATRKFFAVLALVWVPISPLRALPFIEPIPNLTVPAGKSVVIPVFGTTTNHWKLNYSAVSSQPAAVVPRLHSDNPWLKMSVTDFGDLTFMLFADRSPVTAGFIRGLADTAFYDGLRFHRVIRGFVVQTGDPAGDGTGGPDFSFEDEFDPTLIFSGTGQLAMANGGKDSNGSQLFVTLGPQRSLDFNHTIFGQLVRGFDVLGKIAETPTSGNAPISPVVISRAGTVTNYADTVLTLLASAQVDARATITLTARDGHGGEFLRSFDVRVTADTVDDPVILGTVTNAITAVNTPVNLTLRATDLENDPIDYAAQLVGNSTNHAKLAIAANIVTVTPNTDYQGPIYCLLGARQRNATRRGSTSNPFDLHFATIGVGAAPITALATNILTIPDFALVNRRVAHFTSASPSRVATNFIASIIWGDFRATDADIIRLSDGSYVAVGSHRYLTPGEYRITVDIADDLGATAHVESVALVLPSLAISLDQDGLTVSWPFKAARFSLERTSELFGTGRRWEPVPVAAEAGDFDQKFRSQTMGNEFFRLRR